MLAHRPHRLLPTLRYLRHQIIVIKGFYVGMPLDEFKSNAKSRGYLFAAGIGDTGWISKAVVSRFVVAPPSSTAPVAWCDVNTGGKITPGTDHGSGMSGPYEVEYEREVNEAQSICSRYSAMNGDCAAKIGDAFSIDGFNGTPKSQTQGTVEAGHDDQGALLCLVRDSSVIEDGPNFRGNLINSSWRLVQIELPFDELNITGGTEEAVAALSKQFGLDFQISTSGNGISYVAETSSSVPGYKTRIEVANNVRLELVPIPNLN